MKFSTHIKTAPKLLAAFLAIAPVSGSFAVEQPPNVIFILADDLGFGDVGANNPESKIPTPAMGRLAPEAIRFTDAHSPSASRIRTRTATFLTRSSRTQIGTGPIDAGVFKSIYSRKP